ncbi:MAG: DUF423 domain-containing protein [Flavobacterium sp.]|nr:DUF423 domain-containing protein [Flavobacterium sp.]
MNKKIVLTALVFGIFTIVLGAFGAHGLKQYLSAEQLSSFEVGVKYLMFHALFLMFVANTNLVEENEKNAIFYFTLFGTLFFSGSIFLLTTKSVSGIDFKFLGPVTPIGGLLLIAAWIWLFIKILMKK